MRERKKCTTTMPGLFFKLHLIQYFLLCYNHTPLCKVAYKWRSATLAIYYKYLTNKTQCTRQRKNYCRYEIDHKSIKVGFVQGLLRRQKIKQPHLLAMFITFVMTCFWAVLSYLQSSNSKSSDSEDLPMIPRVLIDRLINLTSE